MRNPNMRRAIPTSLLSVVWACSHMTPQNNVTRPANLTLNPCSRENEQIIVRISEIDIAARYLDVYRAILIEEVEASVRLEPGVISIFPMYQKDYPTTAKILAI